MRKTITRTRQRQGFTVGTVASAGVFPTETEDFADQVRVILAITSLAQALATAPRRIALLAHDTRKLHLSAWVMRHADWLTDYQVFCAGGTGHVLSRVALNLSIHRLKREGA